MCTCVLRSPRGPATGERGLGPGRGTRRGGKGLLSVSAEPPPSAAGWGRKVPWPSLGVGALLPRYSPLAAAARGEGGALRTPGGSGAAGMV